MSLISRVIKSLINGVSQQAPSVRLDNQVEEQLNMIPDISGVLTRRSPVVLDDIIDHNGSRVYTDEDAMITMTIDNEKVALGIKPDGTVYRFDENNAATTIVQAASVKTYLSHTDKNEISSIETSDSLIILNRGVTVTQDTKPTASSTSNQRALIWVTSALSGATYKVYRNGGGTPVGHYKAGSADTPESIIKGLIDGTLTSGTTPSVSTTNMTAAIGGTKTFHQENNTVIVRSTDLDNMTVECDYGDYIYAIKEAESGNNQTIILASKLPNKIATGIADGLNPIGTANFLVRVNPSVNEDLTTYYLRYSSVYDAWVEESDGYVTSITANTMPVTITKSGLATITVAHSDFIKPKVGDDLSNPAPSIVGSKIRDIIIYNSRLGFASESTLVFSVIDDYFNLYRTTTSKYLISDAVDLELDSSKLGYHPIDNIFTIDNNIIINTGLSQSILAIPINLDISGAIFAQISTFDLGNNVPIPVRRAMYFPIKQGNFTTMKSFQQALDTGTAYTDNPVTKHCEKFIRGSIVQSLFTNDIFLARTDDDSKVIYVQNTYVSEGTILQNAWHKWTFKYDIKYIYSDGDSIKIIFEDNTGNYTLFGTLSLIPAEITEDTDSQIGYEPYLDYKTTDTLLVDKRATIVGGETASAIAILLASAGIKVVEKSLGKLVPYSTSNTIYGDDFVSSVTLSEIIPKSQSKDGSLTKIGYALLMLRRMSITLGFSGRLNITVTRTKRVVYTHNFIPELLGNIVIGREPVNTREAKFPINGRSQDVVIKISTVDTFTPLQIHSAEWQGQLISQGGR